LPLIKKQAFIILQIVDFIFRNGISARCALDKPYLKSNNQFNFTASYSGFPVIVFKTCTSDDPAAE